MESVELPHGEGMRWVREAELSADGSTAVARMEVGAGFAFVVGGELMSSAMIEVMAQTAAAGSVLRARGSGKRVKSGVLAAIQKFAVCAVVRVGDVVEVRAVEEKSFGALTQVAFEARVGESLVAMGRMTFHLVFE